MTYNANGIRTGKTVNGVKHTYTLDGTKILREEWNGNTIIPLYDNEESVCGIKYNGEPYYFHKNLQGDVIAIVDKDVKTVAIYTYDAWGVPEIKYDISGCSIATINPFRYRGYYYDEEIGLYYLQSRYYDAIVGRFVNGDDVMILTIIPFYNKNINVFEYCSNEPIYNYDPLGYLRLGKHWWNSVAVVSKTIDVIILAIPAFLAIKNVLRAGKIASALAKTASSMSRKALREAFVKMGLKLAAATGWAAAREIGGYVYDIITTIVGKTLGDIIAKAFDKVDGKYDGYLFA